jgi:hypothetical protein
MLVSAMVLTAALFHQDPFDTDDPLDADFRTGIEIGERIPDFRARDATGKVWDFEAIKGPMGALLHFYRSADW